MTTLCSSLDIFRKDVRGNPVWIDTAQDLDDARHRLSQLAQGLPGEYFVYDQRIQSIVASVPVQDCDWTPS